MDFVSGDQQLFKNLSLKLRAAHSSLHPLSFQLKGRSFVLQY